MYESLFTAEAQRNAEKEIRALPTGSGETPILRSSDVKVSTFHSCPVRFCGFNVRATVTKSEPRLQHRFQNCEMAIDWPVSRWTIKLRHWRRRRSENLLHGNDRRRTLENRGHGNQLAKYL